METLAIYFNELSIDFDSFPRPASFQWRRSILGMAATIEATAALRQDAVIVFINESWHLDCDGVPFSERFRSELVSSRDRYRQILRRIKKVDRFELDRQVSLQKKSAIGLMFSELAALEWAHGWAISLASGNSLWLENSLNVTVDSLDEYGNLNEPVEFQICQLSAVAHVESWKDLIQDWGAIIGNSSHLAMLDEHPIVMYSAPLEHEPPHIHLLESVNSHNTLAKFEINPFNRPKGPPTWDSRMRPWIELHKDQLLTSWLRCQRGGHPFALKFKGAA
jgi:hypothetical protein